MYSDEEYSGYVRYIVEDVAIPPGIVEFIDKYPERKLAFVPDDDFRKFTICYMELRRQIITESITHTFDTYRSAERCIDSIFFMSYIRRFRKSSQELLRKHQQTLLDL